MFIAFGTRARILPLRAFFKNLAEDHRDRYGSATSSCSVVGAADRKQAADIAALHAKRWNAHRRRTPWSSRFHPKATPVILTTDEELVGRMHAVA
jgi:hypothetical protein